MHYQNAKVKQEKIQGTREGDAEKEEKPNGNASEKEPRNLKKVHDQKHIEVKILKLEKPAKTSEWGAPIRAHASMVIGSSSTIGR